VVRRTFHLLLVLAGVLGIALCVIAGVLAWRTAIRLTEANRRVFDRVDVALAAGRERVLDVQKRVQDSNLTAEDLRQGVESWARREGSQRLASRQEVDLTIDRLASGLNQAGAWLEVSGASLTTVQQVLELARSMGAAADGSVVDPLVERLAGLKQQLTQSTETVDAIRARVDRAAAGETLEERVSRLAQLTLRAIATLSEIDTRIGDVAERFTEAQSRARALETRTHRYIVGAAIAVLLLITWMAAGQIFLARHGWMQYRGR
jgi:hypothetical protein